MSPRRDSAISIPLRKRKRSPAPPSPEEDHIVPYHEYAKYEADEDVDGLPSRIARRQYPKAVLLTQSSFKALPAEPCACFGRNIRCYD